MPTLEIIRFPGSDAFVADPLVLRDALDLLLDAEGVTNVYYGIQTEDGTTGYLIVGDSLTLLLHTHANDRQRPVWETYERSLNFEQHPSYSDLQSSLSLARSNALDVQHVDFQTDIRPALEAPTTQIGVLTPRPDVPPIHLYGRAMLLRDGLLKEEACHAMTWGESRENRGTWVLASGWDSLQAHLDTVSTGEFLDLIGGLEEGAAIYVEHTNLVKYIK